MNFSNNIILPENFPEHRAVTMTRIDPAYWKVILWRYFVTALVLIAAGALFFLVPDLRTIRWYVAIALLVFIVARYLFQKAAFKRRGYAVREHDIIYRHGILSVITTIVPFNRIQHVAVLEGFISRRYGIASLRIYTAGGASADIKIAGLPADKAFAVKEIILGKIKRPTGDGG